MFHRRLVFIQHVPFEDPGTVLFWAEQNNFRIATLKMWEQHTFPALADFDWLVVMGGPMGANDDMEYPWLSEEKSFMRAAAVDGKVVLGFCLGAQLLAVALDGTVTVNAEKEIGWQKIQMTENGRADKLLAHYPDAFEAFQWHGDTFSVLPPTAVLLATSEGCRHQLFRYGRSTYGFQFHQEITKSNVEAMLLNCADELLTKGKYIQTSQEIAQGIDLADGNNLLLSGFLQNLLRETEKQ